MSDGDQVCRAITDIIVVSNESGHKPSRPGYHLIPVNTNDDSGSYDYVYVLYKLETAPRDSPDFIRDLVVVNSAHNPDISVPDGFTKLDVDLNKGTDVDHIYLAYSKEDRDKDPVSSLFMLWIDLADWWQPEDWKGPAEQNMHYITQPGSNRAWNLNHHTGSAYRIYGVYQRGAASVVDYSEGLNREDVRLYRNKKRLVGQSQVSDSFVLKLYSELQLITRAVTPNDTFKIDEMLEVGITKTSVSSFNYDLGLDFGASPEAFSASLSSSLQLSGSRKVEFVERYEAHISNTFSETGHDETLAYAYLTYTIDVMDLSDLAIIDTRVINSTQNSGFLHKPEDENW